MHAVVPLLALTALGIDVGWEPAPAGGWDYIIQVEPEALDALARGVEIASDLPPEIRDVRSLRLRVGDRPVPRTAAKPNVTAVDDEGPRLVTAVEVEPPRSTSRSNSRSLSTDRQRMTSIPDRSSSLSDRSSSQSSVDPPVMGPRMPSSSWQSTRSRDDRSPVDAVPRWDDDTRLESPSSDAQRDGRDSYSRDAYSRDAYTRRTNTATDPPTSVEFGPVDEEMEPRARGVASSTTEMASAGPAYEPPPRSLELPPASSVPRTDFGQRDDRLRRDDEFVREEPRYGSRIEAPADDRYAQPSPRVATRTNSTTDRRLDDAGTDDNFMASQYAYPLTVALVGLFLSMGGNLFLGWMTLDLRNRCRRLLVRLATAAPLRSGALSGGELEF